MSIPRSIHQIYVGGNMPIKYHDWCSRMQRMNERWAYRLWGDELLDHYKEDPIVKWMLATGEKIAFVVDRIRVLLLKELGGIYLDCDCFAVRPLDSIKCWDDPRVGFVAGIRPPDREHVSLHAPGIALIDNTVLASEPNGAMANRLCGLYTATSRKQTGMSCGREILRNADERTVLLNWRYFYALKEEPESIVLHDAFNAASWSDGKSRIPILT